MPELPEVQTIVSNLNRRLKNKKIASLKSLDGKVWRLSKNDLRRLLGRPVKAVRRRAKMIIIDLGGDVLLVHLKMTGQLVFKSGRALIAGGHPIIGQGKKLPNKFTRVIFDFSDGGKLYFNDVRRFGWIRLLAAPEFLKLDRGLGVEPLSKKFTLAYFAKALAGRKSTTVKQALLEQKHVSGIGNIYADEALFAAGIKPFRRVKTLKPAEIKKLYLAIPKILKLAIKYRGTSFSDYVDARGQAGNFVKYLKVYGRAGERCKRCPGRVKKTKLAGRGTHWCDVCQK